MITTFAVVYCQPTPDHDFTVPIKVVSIIYPDGTVQTTALPVGTAVTWTNLAGKPIAFPPVAHTHDYNTDVTGKPGTIELQEAISALPGVVLTRLTTVQINALTPVEGTEVYDLTLHVKKYWNGTIWKIVSTTN